MNRHWPVIETLYAFGIALVILGHSHSSDWSTFEGTWLVALIQFIYLFHMAMFFGIAGFLFQNSNALERDGYGKWLVRKALRLLVPYVFWSLFALLPKYYFEQHTLAGLTPGYILTSLFCPRQNIWGHFWFLPVLFLAYALFGALRQFLKGGKILPRLTAVALGSICIYFLPCQILWLGLPDLRNALPFFALGMLAQCLLGGSPPVPFAIGEGIGWIRLPLALVLFTVGFLLRGFGSNRSAILPLALMLNVAAGLLATTIPANRAVSWLARHNFTIYLFSWMFQAVVMEICTRLHCQWLGMSGAMFVVGFGGPMLVIWLFEHSPFRACLPLQCVLGIR